MNESLSSLSRHTEGASPRHRNLRSRGGSTGIVSLAGETEPGSETREVHIELVTLPKSPLQPAAQNRSPAFQEPTFPVAFTPVSWQPVPRKELFGCPGEKTHMVHLLSCQRGLAPSPVNYGFLTPTRAWAGPATRALILQCVGVEVGSRTCQWRA